ncbi:MaoC domain protein dehydratase [Kribbella flavida DSM 17836]|uniref:MaoC domain protein dehydratase n=1 Tax=Kribbella flavida (strain DSM 17836 / JCM 10339 / NBRC 14399) TaxID=479435 RepID=D2PKY7_KRIFD|nr:MaoC/PaaZ C-terminal domain-containing protein [Kribbella flavida]ADB32454.1 MaoC domain protein dehydratase [Kribbella flavida DSM 17836]
MPTRRYDDSPGLGSLYARTVKATLRKAEYTPDVDGLTLELPQAAVDQDHLAAYREVTGFSAGPTLPVTYPHVLAFPLHLDLMSDPSFPYKPMGIVHLSNTITQLRPIPLHAELAITVHSGPERPHPKGTVFDVLSEVRVFNEVVWTDSTTLLSRSVGDETAQADVLPDPELQPEAWWELRGNLGRRYAAASGDRNPIHLFKLTAQAFGFPRQIAHGMWTKAAALASLQRAVGLPDAYTVRVDFRKPVLLPSRVQFGYRATGNAIDFALYDDKHELTHLVGQLEPR